MCVKKNIIYTWREQATIEWSRGWSLLLLATTVRRSAHTPLWISDRNNTNGHPDVPTPQSVCWQLQLRTCLLGLQQDISWRWESGLLVTSNNLGLLYNLKDTASFFSHRWNVGTNPDLAFASFGQDSRLPDRRVLGNFPRPQRRPSLITQAKFKVPAHSDPVKRWNYCKADSKCFCLLTDESVDILPPPDTPNIGKAYQDICESLLFAVKNCTPRGRRKNYVPCWDKVCETLYLSFTWVPEGTDSDRTPSSLLSRLGQKKQERWEEAVNSIDYSH